MGKQFPDVSARYGAPMGRTESPLSEGPRAIRIFRVRLDSGGYDDGGAYWGHSRGEALYCAQCDDGGRKFVRAPSRLQAVAQLEIEAFTLTHPPRAEFARLRHLENTGRAGASSIILRQKLQELGF